MNLDPLVKLLRKYEYPLDFLERKATGIAVVGSRVAGCHRPDSDWDVVVFGYRPTSKDRLAALREGWGVRVREHGLDLMFEDQKSPHWLGRELCIHMTGFSFWVQGSQFWDEADLDWDTADRIISRRIRSGIQSVHRIWDGSNQALKDKIGRRLISDSRRLQCVRDRVLIPPTAMLPAEFNVAFLEDVAHIVLPYA